MTRDARHLVGLGCPPSLASQIIAEIQDATGDVVSSSVPLVGPNPSGGDDTVALQNFFNQIVMKGQWGVLAPLDYRTSSALIVGNDTAANYSGFKIQGSGRDATTITNTGASQNAVISWKKNAWRGTYFGDMTLNGNGYANTANVLYFESTEISNLCFRSIHFQNAVTAINLNQGTGGNAEFLKFEEFQTHGIKTFFKSNAPQALDISFVHGLIYYLSAYNDAIIFDLSGSTIGGGIHCYNVGMSPSDGHDKTQSSNSTLIRATGPITSPINFFGGRSEWVTQILDVEMSNVSAIPMPVIFTGHEFTTDFRVGDPTNTKAAMIYWGGSGTGARTRVKFLACRFYPSDPNIIAYPYRVTADSAAQISAFVDFDMSTLNGYDATAYSVGANVNKPGGVAGTAYGFRRCSVNGADAHVNN